MKPLSTSVEDLARAERQGGKELAGHHMPHAVVVGPEGISVLCSLNLKGDLEQTSIIRLRADGSNSWNRKYAPKIGVGRAMARLADGRLAVAGEVRRSELKLQASVFVLDQYGEVRDAGTFGPLGVTGFAAVSASPSGELVAGGMAAMRGFLVEVQLDPKIQEGKALSTAMVNAVRALDEVNGVSRAVDGSVAVVGTQGKSTTGFGATLLLRSAAGRSTAEPQQVLPSTAMGEPAAVVALPEGETYMVGHGLEKKAGATRLWMVRQGAPGKTWLRWHGAPNEEWRARALAVLSDGGVAAAGDARLADGRRVVKVLRWSATGELAWERQYAPEGGETQVAAGIATLEDDLVLAASTSKGPGKTNVWVLRLGSDGEIRWQRVIGPPSE